MVGGGGVLMVIDDFMGGEGDGGGVLTVIDDFMGGEGDGGGGGLNGNRLLHGR